MVRIGVGVGEDRGGGRVRIGVGEVVRIGVQYAKELMG